MAQIKRTSRGARVRLEGNEVQLLGQLADEVDLLLSGNADDATPPSARPAPSGEPASPDELAELTGLAGLTWPTADEVEVPDDPALRRLLPDAYRDDAEAAAEFRRYTDATLRGGKRADVTVVRQGLALVGVGLVIGLPAALLSTRYIANLLVGVSARDPITYLVVAFVLAATGALAAWVPARRAASVDPKIVLSEAT